MAVVPTRQDIQPAHGRDGHLPCKPGRPVLRSALPIRTREGARTTWTYDEVNRPTRILHEDDTAADLHEVRYAWTINNWVEKRVEIAPGLAAAVSFAYDNRGRLTRETRVEHVSDPNEPNAVTTYDIEYEYDPLGNRLRKTDSVAQLETLYEYDLDRWSGGEPQGGWDYPTLHNRLLRYEVFDTSQQPQESLREVYYTYYKTGAVSNITMKDSNGDPNAVDWYHDLAFYYWRGGQLHRALWGKWQLDQNENPIDYRPLAAREFRFDSARGRYLVAELDVAGDPNNPGVPSPYPHNWTLAAPMLWTDYLGDIPTGDFEVATSSPWTRTERTRYLGLGAEQDVSGGDKAYYHSDLIDSTMLTTDADANAEVRIAYTAFGEVLTSGDPNGAGGPGEGGAPGGAAPAGAPRYQYAGGWGYESGLLTLQGADTTLPPITLQHVGHRWYQPDSGRFVQRDPIGIAGGLNVYSYVAQNPIFLVDPYGLEIEADVLVKGNKIVVHWYDVKRTPPFARHKYLNTNTYSLINDSTGTGIGDDAFDLCRTLAKEKVKALKKGIEKLDEETRKQAKRWLGKAGKLPKTLGGVVIDGASGGD